VNPHRRQLLHRLLSLGALGVAPSALRGKSLYSYRDADGQLHLSDSPPAVEDAAVTVRRLAVERAEERLRVYQRGPRQAPRVEVDNRHHGPVEVAFSLAEGENLHSEPPLPLRLVVPADSAMTAFRLAARDARFAWRYRYRYRWTPGDPAARHDHPSYALPYASGHRYIIAQAFGGPWSHHDAANRYAVDFGMPEGAPVHAARAGVVMDVAEDFFSGGSDRQRYLHRANYLRLLHADGSMAVYAHLRWESALVRAGDRVARGQRIAQSGNTGFTTGPHLHFAVQLNRGLRLDSVPFEFSAREHPRIAPRPGLLLTAT